MSATIIEHVFQAVVIAKLTSLGDQVQIRRLRRPRWDSCIKWMQKLHECF